MWPPSYQIKNDHGRRFRRPRTPRTLSEVRPAPCGRECRVHVTLNDCTGVFGLKLADQISMSAENHRGRPMK